MSGDRHKPVTATAELDQVIDKRYRITAVLGEGGMGSVYRAEHLRLRRPVALKLLHSNTAAGSEISKRFEREAYAAARLDHPNCVGVSDFGELEDGTLYLAMEFVDGTLLEDLVAREAPLDPVRALHITRHVLQGLQHAHEAGIVHRDIKPANVMLIDRDGDRDFARILDFGLAKLVGEAAIEEGGKKLTQAGVAFGTPLYLSPEQALGGPIDHRADIYSTSVMLFEMLAGAPPFDAREALDVLMMHVTADIPRIGDMAPNVAVPEALEQLVARGLGKRATDRYADTSEYIEAIERCLDALSAGATVVTPQAMHVPSSPGIPNPRPPAQAHVGTQGQMYLPTNAPTAPAPSVLQKTSAAIGAVVRTLTEAPIPSNPRPNTADPPAPQPRPGERPVTAPIPPSDGRVTGHTRVPASGPVKPATGPVPAYRVPPLVRLKVFIIANRWLVAGAVLLLIITIAMCSGGDGGALAKYRTQLENGDSCEKRRSAVGKLRRLGDKRAIPDLERAMDRPDNRCLVRDAQRALDQLESR